MMAVTAVGATVIVVAMKMTLMTATEIYVTEL